MRYAITPQFVTQIPEQLEDGVLYISTEYSTAVHRCLCGCGKEVVTPLTPTDWSLSYYGDTVSLSPSIGNWSFPCRSHYWIRRNRVQWAGDMPESLINAGRAKDRRDKAAYYARNADALAGVTSSDVRPTASPAARGLEIRGAKAKSWWSRLLTWLVG